MTSRTSVVRQWFHAHHALAVLGSPEAIVKLLGVFIVLSFPLARAADGQD